MAKDPQPEDGRATRGSTPRAADATGRRAAAGATARTGQQRGRTRPPANVVTAQKPWGLIAGAVAVVVFAAAVLTYAVVQVNRANANKVTSASQIAGLATFAYPKGQPHVSTPVQYKESPPVGGPHDPVWADCTGTVYTVDIRHENAVHSLEHGATWITYNPATIAPGDLAVLQKLVRGRSGLMLSPYPGESSPISLQSWNHQLSVSSASDKRVKQFVDFMTFNPTFTPEPGASCANPAFAANPVVAGSQGTPVGPTDAPTAPMTPAPTSPAPTSPAPMTPAPATPAPATPTP